MAIREFGNHLSEFTPEIVGGMALTIGIYGIIYDDYFATLGGFGVGAATIYKGYKDRKLKKDVEASVRELSDD